MLTKIESPRLNNTREKHKAELTEQAFIKNGCCWFTVISLSMKPTLLREDRVLVMALGQDKVRAGDIVLFRSGMDLIVHRVVIRKNINGSLIYWQKGDASNYREAISGSQIIGKIVAVKRGTDTFQLDTLLLRNINYLKTWYSRMYSLYHDTRYSISQNTLKTTPYNPLKKLIVKQALLFRLLAGKIMLVFKNIKTFRKFLRVLNEERFIIAPAQESDLREIRKFFQLVENTSFDLSSQNFIMLVARKNKFIAGCVIIENIESAYQNWWVDVIRVGKEFRGLGIGTGLIGAAEKYLAAKNIYSLKLWVKEANYQALNFYKKLGYATESINLLKKNGDIMVMEKIINGATHE